MKEVSLLFVAAALAGLRMEVVHGIQVGVISNLRVETEVNNRYAVTHVTSRMKNPSNVSQELFFKMQLPKTAFVSSLIMEVEGKNYTSSVQEKEQAQKTYDKAKKRGKNTGLVQQSLKNFQVSANVAPHHKITFYLKYEELLQRFKGSYNLSINVKPGQAVQELMVKVSIKETEPLTNVILQQSPEKEYESLDVMKMELPSDPPKYGKSYLMSSLNGTAPLKITWASPREVKFVYHRVNKKSNSVSDGVLSLSYDIERKADGGEVKLEDDYFAHFFSPEGLPLLPKHTIFVIDVSGSMDGRKLQDVKSAMVAILKDMKKHDSFEVISFSDGVSSLGVFRGRKKSLGKALKEVKKLKTLGGTNINQALLDAVANIQAKKPNMAKQIVFLTDGSPTTGVVDLDIIRKNVRSANKGRLSIFSLAFGAGADLQFLRKISSDNRGFARQIYEHSSPADQLTGFYDEISKPLLYDLDLDYDNASVVNDSLVHSGRPIYYVGDEVVVTGKLLPGVTSIDPKVTGQGKKGSVQLPVSRTSITTPPPGSDNILERLWAYMTIQNLLEKMEVEEDPAVKEDMKSRALEMALDYHFVTKLTSLVVVRPEDLEDEDSEEENKTKHLENDSEEDEENDSRGNMWSKKRGQVLAADLSLPVDDEDDLSLAAPLHKAPNRSPPLSSQIVHGRMVSPVHQPHYSQPRRHFRPHHTSVDRDPHFLVYARNSTVPFCFDFHGKSGDVLSLVRDEISGVIINGLVTSSVSKSEKTFLTAFFLSLGRVKITITPSTFQVDCLVTEVSPKLEESDDSFEARQEVRSTKQRYDTTNGWGDETKSVDNAQPAEVKSHPNKCNHSLTWEDAVGFRFLNVHFELWKEDKVVVVLGNTLARFVVTRSTSKRGQRFLGFYIEKQDIFSTKTKGILGEFSNKFVSTVDTIRKTERESASTKRTMIGTIQAGEGATSMVRTYAVRRLSGLISEKIPCHFVRNSGRGLLRSKRKEYILPCLRC
ncbi:inter-alpha-trypsin inhibitor heavy chain H3-like [Oratosquilla oratoria]|uniref:inter-alpha-trypsin inhibitor heavy chain H3-like n=1 Tax=Oratosquilla oratoria TaxID=337810 RepID=UPI003F76C721